MQESMFTHLSRKGIEVDVRHVVEETLTALHSAAVTEPTAWSALPKIAHT